jgi:hypothetical protein
MSICEFLNCSFSELPKRCPSLVDQPMIMEYIKQKAARENALLSSSTPNIPKPKIPRKR